MGQTKTVADLWEKYTELNNEIRDLKRKRDDLDRWIPEVIAERDAIVRQIETEQGEIDWGY